jgi:hypothetical protein
MVQRTPRGPDRFAAEEQRRRSHPVAAHLLADRDEPVPTVVVLIEQAEPGQRAEQATQERLLGAAHNGEVRARCGTGRELVRDADLHGDPDALGLADHDDQLEQPRARVLNAGHGDHDRFGDLPGTAPGRPVRQPPAGGVIDIPSSAVVVRLWGPRLGDVFRPG